MSYGLHSNGLYSHGPNLLGRLQAVRVRLELRIQRLRRNPARRRRPSERAAQQHHDGLPVVRVTLLLLGEPLLLLRVLEKVEEEASDDYQQHEEDRPTQLWPYVVMALCSCGPVRPPTTISSTKKTDLCSYGLYSYGPI